MKRIMNLGEATAALQKDSMGIRIIPTEGLRLYIWQTSPAREAFHLLYSAFYHGWGVTEYESR